MQSEMGAVRSEMGVMRSDIADLKATQAKQGEQIAEIQEALTRVAVTQNFQKLHFNPFATQNDKKVCYTPPMRKYIVWVPVQYEAERSNCRTMNL